MNDATQILADYLNNERVTAKELSEKSGTPEQEAAKMLRAEKRVNSS